MSWPNPTGAASPAGPGCPPPTGNPRSGSAPTASRTRGSSGRSPGRDWTESFFADLERDQRERATMSMLIPPQMVNTMVPSGVAGPARLHRGVLRRPGAPVHDPGVQRPADRLAVAPVRAARLAARGRDVGGRGPDPPLPDQGAGRAAADLPAVLRPLHPDGPGRQPDGPDRQAQVRAWPAKTGWAPCWITCAAPPACATWWSPAGTWPTCPGRGWSRSWPRCWRSTRSATSGWPARR